MYQKNFGDAILTLSELQSMIDGMDDEEQVTKNNYKFFAEFNKFLAFGHSQKEEETLESLIKMDELRSANTKSILKMHLIMIKKIRIITGKKWM